MRTSDPDELAAADAHCRELEFTFPPAQAEVITDIEMRLRRVEAVRPAAALSAMRKKRSGGRKGGRPRKHTPDCAQCGQPMLPEGMKKEINQYDHASGCPLGGRPRKEGGASESLERMPTTPEEVEQISKEPGFDLIELPESLKEPPLHLLGDFRDSDLREVMRKARKEQP